MKIVLAGFNVDCETLGSVSELATTVGRAALTPETLSAAYARISRSPDAVDVLRCKARLDVAAARASNQKIVFEMGHKSIAEHAVFAFDLMGVSRLAIESIERSRLASYTEKSQRYQKVTKEEVVLPLEFHSYQPLFWSLIDLQFEAYQQLLLELPKVRGVKPEEDARFVLPLAMSGQLGMTINARSLEHMIGRLRSHPLYEVRDVGERLQREAGVVAPSLIRYTDPIPLRMELRSVLLEQYPVEMREIESSEEYTIKCRGTESEEMVAAALLHEVSQDSFEHCFNFVTRKTSEERLEFFKKILALVNVHDAVPRAFELIDVIYELDVSASCFAQLKRHRMMTLLTQDYCVPLGYTVPPQIVESGKEYMYREVMDQTRRVYDTLVRDCPDAASYVLTQAHKRRVIVKMNARELYAFSRLREDAHAQWEIRDLAKAMLEGARKVMPLTLLLACGKDVFDATKLALFGGHNADS